MAGAAVVVADAVELAVSATGDTANSKAPATTTAAPTTKPHTPLVGWEVVVGAVSVIAVLLGAACGS